MASQTLRRNRSSPSESGRVQEELTRLKKLVPIASEVTVRWLPGRVVHGKAGQLEEEVRGNVILIYAEDPDWALELLHHGFIEWLLNQHSQPYRQMINRLLDVFEDQQYAQKEKIADALTKVLSHALAKGA